MSFGIAGSTVLNAFPYNLKSRKENFVMRKFLGFKSVRTLIAIASLVFVLGVGILGHTLIGGSSAKSANAASAMTASTICTNYYKWRGEYVLYAVSSAQMCYDGSHVWQGGWNNCSYYVVVPGWSVNQTWCGTWNNGGSYVDIGSNFTVSGYGVSWPCYFRVRIYSNGSTSAPWGC